MTRPSWRYQFPVCCSNKLGPVPPRRRARSRCGDLEPQAVAAADSRCVGGRSAPRRRGWPSVRTRAAPRRRVPAAGIRATRRRAWRRPGDGGTPFPARKLPPWASGDMGTVEAFPPRWPGTVRGCRVSTGRGRCPSLVIYRLASTARSHGVWSPRGRGSAPPSATLFPTGAFFPRYRQLTGRGTWSLPPLIHASSHPPRPPCVCSGDGTVSGKRKQENSVGLIRARASVSRSRPRSVPGEELTVQRVRDQDKTTEQPARLRLPDGPRLGVSGADYPIW